MRYDIILPIAQGIADALAPFCYRIAIAGSIRRRKPEPRDIEIVAIPKKTIVTDLIGDQIDSINCEGFSAIVNSFEHVKGDAVRGKYMQRVVHSPAGPVKLDLFTATPDNWGLIFAMRTGSADFSGKVLARGWVRAGYHSIDGQLTKDGAGILVAKEEDLFRLIGVPFVRPEDRK